MQPPWGKKLTDDALRIIKDAAHAVVKREAERAERFAQRHRLGSPSLEQGGVAAEVDMEATWKRLGKRQGVWKTHQGC